MAFASIGGNFSTVSGTTSRFLNLHGQIYHRASSLHANDGRPKYAQLYMVDSDIALRERIEQLNGVHPEDSTNIPTNPEMAILQEVFPKLILIQYIKYPLFIIQYFNHNQILDFIHRHIAQVSPYVRLYQQMFELELQETEAANRENRQPNVFRMYLLSGGNQPAIHPGRLNLPQGREIAAVFVDNDGAPPANVDICIHPRHVANQNLHRINYMSANADPLCYPLFFPNGELGKI